MITPKQAAAILTKINLHHGNMPIDDFALATFLEEIDPHVTVDECMEAVRSYYAQNAGDKWLTAGKINAMVRAKRDALRPSDWQVQEEARQLEEVLGRVLTPDEFWWFRRARRGLLSLERSARAALEPASEERGLIAVKPRVECSGSRGLSQLSAADFGLRGVLESSNATNREIMGSNTQEKGEHE